MGIPNVARRLVGSATRESFGPMSQLSVRFISTEIRLTNSRSRQLEVLRVANRPFLTWYCCGPTVYDSAHLGHAFTYLHFDLIRRVLESVGGLKVIYMMNITDLDDKIIARANTTGSDWRSLARSYEREFWQDMRLLGIRSPTITARITDFIPQTVAFVASLVEQKIAYVVDDGTVYFDTGAYGKMGKFQRAAEVHQTMLAEEMTIRKRAPADFALWKGAKLGEPCWPTPFSSIPGRPGWHTECSTVASHYFGRQVDLHSGGKDLCFPHHENEEAQCCAYHQVDDWVTHWLHAGHLCLADHTNTKMSKSLRNFVTIRHFLQTYRPQDLRMFCMLHHYRSDCEYTPEAIERAAGVVNRLTTFLNTVDAYLQGSIPAVHIDESHLYSRLGQVEWDMRHRLTTDFDIAGAVHALLDLVSHVNGLLLPATPRTSIPVASQSSSSSAVAAVSLLVETFLTSLGLVLPSRRSAQFKEVSSERDQEMPDMGRILDDAVQFRSVVRRSVKEGKKEGISGGDLMKACDGFRDSLLHIGVRLKDHGETSSWEVLPAKRVAQKSISAKNV